MKAPTLYHHFFGDKRGLMDAVIDDAFDRYMTQKRGLRHRGIRSSTCAVAGMRTSRSRVPIRPSTR